jgi:hypothetical protein
MDAQQAIQKHVGQLLRGTGILNALQATQKKTYAAETSYKPAPTKFISHIRITEDLASKKKKESQKISLQWREREREELQRI